jgi:hypothetical protein
MNFIANLFGLGEDNREQLMNKKPKICSSGYQTSRNINLSDVHKRKLVKLLDIINKLQDVMVDLEMKGNDDEDSTSIVPVDRCCEERCGTGTQSRQSREAPRAVAEDNWTFYDRMIGNDSVQSPKIGKQPTPCRRFVIEPDQRLDLRPKAKAPRCTAVTDEFKHKRSMSNDLRGLELTRSEPCIYKSCIKGSQVKLSTPSHTGNFGRNAGKSTAKKIDGQSPSEVDVCSIMKYVSCGYLECSG